MAGQRRLKEEMGMDVALESIGRFHYTAHFENGLIENEVDHVLWGVIEAQAISPDPREVQAYRWVTLYQLYQELHDYPRQFTPWLAQALSLIEKAGIIQNIPNDNRSQLN